MPDQVEPGLWIGDIGDAKDSSLLSRLGVTHVISAAPEHDLAFSYHVKVLRFVLSDKNWERARPVFGETVHYIQEAYRFDGTVFVHCQEGISRSATLVLAYLMISRRSTLSEAHSILKAVRPRIEPNPGFLKELRFLERDITGKVSSVQPLTRLDPGWKDDTSPATHLKEEIENFVAAYSRPQDPVQGSNHLDEIQRAAANLSLDELKDTLQNATLSTIENFGTATHRSSLAHRALSRSILIAFRSRGDENIRAHELLLEMKQTVLWEQLTLDVPLADSILQNIMKMVEEKLDN